MARRNLPRVQKIVLILLAFIAAAYVAYLLLLFGAQRSILYPGTKNRVAATAPGAPGLEVLKLTTRAAEVEALFLPALNSDGSAPMPLLIFGHGNGEVTDFWIHDLDGFRTRGIGVLLVEYPRYGRSTGSPSEAGIRAAMDAAYDRIVQDPRVDAARIMAFGQSLGSGAVCLLAEDRPLRALILQSAFPSLAIFAARFAAPAFLLRDRFDNLSRIAHFAGPVLVIHGRNDELIPWQQGRRLAEASPHAEFKLYDCGHGCWDPERLPFWQDADAFLSRAGILRAAPPLR